MSVSWVSVSGRTSRLPMGHGPIETPGSMATLSSSGKFDKFGVCCTTSGSNGPRRIPVRVIEVGLYLSAFVSFGSRPDGLFIHVRRRRRPHKNCCSVATHLQLHNLETQELSKRRRIIIIVLVPYLHTLHLPLRLVKGGRSTAFQFTPCSKGAGMPCRLPTTLKTKSQTISL